MDQQDERRADGAEAELFRLAVDHAWGWFTLHSSQRMQFVNFLIVSLTVTTGAYAAALGGRYFPAAAAIALGGAILTVVFWRLDVRTRELVQASEPALAAVERRLAEQVKVPELNFVKRVESPKAHWATYRLVLRTLTVTWFTLFLAGLMYAVACMFVPSLPPSTR